LFSLSCLQESDAENPALGVQFLEGGQVAAGAGVALTKTGDQS
jgi:hypothetical protein